MLRKIGLAVLAVGAVLVAAAAVFILTRPDGYRVERSAEIAAPADAVFGLVNDLHQWEKWSPWAKLDPNMTQTYDGPTAGPGAVHKWSGNDQVGEGRLTILDSKPGESVAMRLEFIRPFTDTSDVSFRLTPTPGGTRVVWAMEGRHNLMSKAMSAFCDIDKMVGGDFEKGLANLDTAARAR